MIQKLESIMTTRLEEIKRDIITEMNRQVTFGFTDVLMAIQFQEDD
jgi:hypothetical protein